MVATVETERDTRQHILTNAAQLFSERGFGNVSIRDICEAAKITAPTIYHYFGNKDHLFQEVVRNRLNLQSFSQRLIAAVESQPDPDSKLSMFIHEYLSAFPRDFFNPGLFLQRTTRIYDTTKERVSAEFENIETLLLVILRQGIKKGVFRPVDPGKARSYLMNLLMSYVLGEVHYHQQYDPDETALFIHDLFTNGICQPGK